MAKATIDEKLRGPKSPHSDERLEDVSGRELDAWVAAELDGYTGVSKRGDGNYEGNKGGRRLVPDYRNPSSVKQMAGKLTGGKRLVLMINGSAVNVDDAGVEMCELASRALILESLKRRGAI